VKVDEPENEKAARRGIRPLPRNREIGELRPTTVLDAFGPYGALRARSVAPPMAKKKRVNEKISEMWDRAKRSLSQP